MYGNVVCTLWMCALYIEAIYQKLKSKNAIRIIERVRYYGHDKENIIIAS